MQRKYTSAYCKPHALLVTERRKDRMKKLITVLILFAVLAALLLAYVLVSGKNRADAGNETESGSSEPDVIYLHQSDSKDITEITYTYKDAEIRLACREEQWQVSDDSAYPLGQDKPKAMASAIATVAAYRLIDSSGTHFADYGLEKPTSVIRVSYADGSSITYRIGSYISFTKAYYLNIEGKNEVYTVASALLDYFSYALSDLFEPDKLPSVKEDYVTAISVKRPGADPFTVEAEHPEDDPDTVVWRAGDEEISSSRVSGMISAVTGLPLDTLAFWGEQSEETLASLGFGEEDVTTVTLSYYELVTISVDDDSVSDGSKKVSHTFTVRIGGKVPARDPAETEDAETSAETSAGQDGEEASVCYYVSVENSDLIYSVPEARLEALLSNA